MSRSPRKEVTGARLAVGPEKSEAIGIGERTELQQPIRRLGIRRMAGGYPRSALPRNRITTSGYYKKTTDDPDTQLLYSPVRRRRRTLFCSSRNRRTVCIPRLAVLNAARANHVIPSPEAKILMKRLIFIFVIVSPKPGRPDANLPIYVQETTRLSSHHL